MSGAQFLQVLEEIGYPGLNDLDVTSVDWLFEDDSKIAFLNWFCNNVTNANVVPQHLMRQ